jgi:cobalt transporter subunit CbtA
MFRKLVFSAAGAGLAVCLVVSVLQFFTTEPLILHAEVYEKAGEAASSGHGSAMPAMGQPAVASTPIASAAASAPAHEHEAGAWEPADGLERTLYTTLANLLVGIAISLMILGAMALKGDPIDARRGLVWGVAGFVAVQLLPALGLPPELPGTPSADLFARQAWWLTTAAASAVGIFLLLRGGQWLWRVIGVVVLVAPHIIGAPEAPSLIAGYPAGFAREFVIASLVVSAVLWSVSGFAAGWLHERLSRTG